MSNRTLYLFAALIFFLALALFYVLAPSDTTPALIGSGDGRRLTLLDSAFWSADANAEPDFARLTDEMNPLTGERYTVEQIQRIQQLWKLFPENSLLPRPSRDRFRQEKEQERMAEVTRNMTSGSASESDIMKFYDARRREAEDRMQLVEHVLTETNWSVEVLERYKGMLAQDKVLLQRIGEEKTTALELLRERKTGSGEK